MQNKPSSSHTIWEETTILECVMQRPVTVGAYIMHALHIIHYLFQINPGWSMRNTIQFKHLLFFPFRSPVIFFALHSLSRFLVEGDRFSVSSDIGSIPLILTD